MSPRPLGQPQRPELPGRILESFEERARQDGPRSVVMAELARDLGISTRTLYQVFPSKAELVRELMEAWASKVEAEQQQRRRTFATAKERMLDATEAWLAAQEHFSRTFWSQVRADFPAAAAILDRQMRKSFQVLREFITPQIHGDLHADLSLILLMRCLRQASNPSLCNHLGLSRHEALAQAVELWCRGALGSPDAKG